MKNKFARICWNTKDWRVPTGDAKRIETGDTFVATYGFGLEEWLFNNEWIINGYRYGMLQPIGKYYKGYSGHRCSIRLYTFTPEKQCLLIGTIHDAYVPQLDELNHVLKISEKNGWIKQMRCDVERIGADESWFDRVEPTEIANLRFRPKDVHLLDPRERVVGDHVISTKPWWYHPYDWTDNDPLTKVQPPARGLADPRRSEDELTRAAQEGKKYDPWHVRLQNRLYEHLCGIYGRDVVLYEHNYVDLVVRKTDGDIFFEVKIEVTVKRCIRMALGQLLEYAHYPDCSRAMRLVVVGNTPANDFDRKYLAQLRRRYDLPLYYSCFSSDGGKLTEEV